MGLKEIRNELKEIRNGTQEHVDEEKYCLICILYSYYQVTLLSMCSLLVNHE